MSYTELVPHGNSESLPAFSDQASLDIFASVQIEAEARRVLYALAMPEYMEAWIELPEVDRIECHSERRSFDRFRIDLFCSGERLGRIYGSCLLSKPDKITYHWDKDHGGSRASSTVEIRLRGGLSRCTLQLKHSGFCNQAESEWHCAMWHCSLSKLCGLMAGISNLSQGSPVIQIHGLPNGHRAA